MKAAANGIATGHRAESIAAGTEGMILSALAGCACKFIWRDEAGQHQEMPLGEGLKKVSRRGTYCAMHLERIFPTLVSLLVPEGAEKSAIERINLYISPPRSGTPLHFDVRWIIVVQLAGSKLWQVAESPAVERPAFNLVADEQAGTARYGDEELALPDRMAFVLLRPGDWLLVPWGTWHGTYSLNGSVSATLALGEGRKPDRTSDLYSPQSQPRQFGPRMLC